MRVGYPASVHGFSACADDSAEGAREFADELEIVGLFEAAAARDHDACSFEVLEVLNVALEGEDPDWRLGGVFAGKGIARKADHRASASGVGGQLHRMRADRRHLGLVAGCLDRGHDVPADGGAGLEKESGVFLDGEFCAVGGETRAEFCREIGHEGAARCRGGGEEDLRLALAHKIEEDLRPYLAEKIAQKRVFNRDDAVCAVGDQRFRVFFGEGRSGHNSAKRAPRLSAMRPGPRKQLKRDDIEAA